MREELNRSLSVGGVKVAEALRLVEEELSTWQCKKYMHITRAFSVSEERVIELETIFSQPSQDRPVPVAVVFVYFHLDTATMHLTYHFEQEYVEHEVGGKGLARDKFEHWLDRIITDKLQVRQLHALATPFEETRLAPPPMFTAEEGEDEEDAEEDGEETLAVQQPLTSEMVQKAQQEEKLPLSQMLANIFDAADEEDEFELTHKEVADLLYATPLGLGDWDIKLLLTTARELESGKIEYRPFVQAAPEIIEALLKRRAAFGERPQSDAHVTVEAIELCYGEEIEEVARATKEAFALTDTAAKGTLSRHEFRSCLMQRTERLSVLEVQMLMQMCKEDEFGQVPYEDIVGLLQQLRIDALHNSLVETDVKMLRTHLILLARRTGMLSPDNKMPVWFLKTVLLSADQLCLSRMQIHVVLSIVQTDEQGEVDMSYFLRVCCTVIPHMFDTQAFAEKAATIAKEKADAQARQELEELQGVNIASAQKKNLDDDVEEEPQVNAPDRETVEKGLVALAQAADEGGNKHRAQQTLDVRKFMEAMKPAAVTQQFGLSEAELRGFIAEADLDERGEVSYGDHIKTWVPIIFELRRSRIYDSILTKDWSPASEHLVDLSSYEFQMPIQVVNQGSSTPSGSRRRPSSSGRRSFNRLSSNSIGGEERERNSRRRPSMSRGSGRREHKEQSSFRRPGE